MVFRFERTEFHGEYPLDRLIWSYCGNSARAAHHTEEDVSIYCDQT